MEEIADAMNEAGEQRGIIIVSSYLNRFVDDLCPEPPKIKILPKPKSDADAPFSGLELIVAGAVFEQNAAMTANLDGENKMKNIFYTAFIIFSLAMLPIVAVAQVASGGNFTLEQSVIAGGGGQDSTGGAFSLDGTIGQSVAGNAATGSPFSVTGGFWNFTPLAPTAARVAVGGRVVTANGIGIDNVQIILTDQNGAVRTTRTSLSGNYKFDDVEVGETYIISVSARRFTFSQPIQVVAVFDKIGNIDFIADN